MAIDMDRQAKTLNSALVAIDLTHLNVVKRGKTLTIKDGSHPEARLSLVGTGRWRLDYATTAGVGSLPLSWAASQRWSTSPPAWAGFSPTEPVARHAR